MPIPSIQNISIDDDLSSQDHGAIEVTITLSDGKRRWCYFMTPIALQACGDWIDNTQVRFHYAAPHMIVIAERLTEGLIHKALRSIERSGEILDCTRALGDAQVDQQGAPADADKPRC